MKKWMKGAVGMVLSAAIAASSLTPLAYKNGGDIENQWSNPTLEYGVGDPFVMKYDGVFYLYVSTLDGNTGIRVWSSKNMVDWHYEGICNDESDTVVRTAYAPEVTYWNGTFYMYTAPGGGDHRVLTAKSPTGPFKRVGERLHNYDGNGIDGSVYIDEDEQASKYFYHASGDCIRYDRLSDDLLSATGNTAIPAANIIGHWTEGPSVFKRNGKYYMTYTGNHVQADNYMVEYAVGDTPVNMQEPAENRLLINTEEGITGLGHNSTVIGPDLDSRYIVYHSLVSNTNAPERRLNIDRLVFNGEKLEVQGPTWWEMDDPKLPDFSDYMENGDNWEGNPTVADGAMTLTDGAQVLSKRTTPEDYTAEFNLRISDAGAGAQAGVLVSYTDARNYVSAYITPNDNTLHLDTVVNGVKTEMTAKLPNEYTYTGAELRKFTVKKENDTFDLYLDDRHLLTANAALGAGKLGMTAVQSTVKASFTAFSSTVNGNEDAASVKPTGSTMDAVHANRSSRVFETGSMRDGSAANLESHYIKDMAAGDSVTFKINPQETARYTAEIRAQADADTTVSLSVDGQPAAQGVALSSLRTFATDVARNLMIDSTAEEITLSVEKGRLDLYSLRLQKQADVLQTVETQSDIDFERLEGSWSETDTTLSTTNANTWSKVAYGSEYLGDYEVSADITLKNGTDAGLLVRLKYATDSSGEAHGIGGCISPDYHYAYYVYLNTGGVALGKQMFNWKVLQSEGRALSLNKTYNLRVRAEGANIKVWLDGEQLMDYVDTDQPILSGRVGMRVNRARVDYQNFRLTHLNTAEPLDDPFTLTRDATPINKHNFTFFSNADHEGYEIRNGAIDFNNGRGRSTKGVLEDAFIDGTVSCDLQMPGTGGFGAGLLVRAERASFGNGIDDLDGVGVHLERGANGALALRVHQWVDKQYRGTLAQKNIEGYFVNHQPRTARLLLTLDGDTMTVSIDGAEQLTVDIGAFEGSLTRRSIGFRANQTAHVTLTNFTYHANAIDTDFTALNAAIAEAAQMDLSPYTPKTAQAVTDALAAARQTAENTGATQKAVDEALEELNAAIRALERKPDTSAAADAVQAADAMDLSGYTAETAKAVTDALAALKALLADVNVTQSQVNAAKTALDRAIAGLKEKPATPPEDKPDTPSTPDKPSTPSTPQTHPTNGTAKVGGKTVLYKNGKQVTGTTLATVGGKTYAVKKGVVQQASKKASYKLVKLGKKSYIVGVTGAVQKSKSAKTGKLFKVGKKRYIVNKKGVVRTAKKKYLLVKAGKRKYIVNKKGVVQVNKKKLKVGKATYKTGKTGIAKKK